MFSLEYIQALQDENTKKARKQGLTPYIAKTDHDPEVRRCSFLAYYLPEGYELTDRQFFVDNSGLGGDTEPALTFEGFLREVKKGYGYAIFEAGEFQICIREYRRT